MSKMMLRILSIIILFVALKGCKVSQSKSIRASYTSFFMENNVNLYFIKPLQFEGPKSRVLIDFTFKDNQAIDTLSVTCNYSIEALPADVKNNMALQADTVHHLYNPATLFTEMKGSKQTIRYTSKISLSSLMDLLHGDYFNCIFTNTANTVTLEDCTATSKTKSQFKKIQSQLLPTLDLKIKL